jgi:hypothetical protein
MPHTPASDSAFGLNGDNPGRRAVAVTPSATVDLTDYPRALYIGVGGDVSVIPVGNAADTAVVFKGLAAGTILPVGVRRVFVSGTTATDIVAIY